MKQVSSCLYMGDRGINRFFRVLLACVHVLA